MTNDPDRRRFLRAGLALGGAIGASWASGIGATEGGGRALIGFPFSGGRNPLVETLLAGLQGRYRPDLGLKPAITPGNAGAVAIDMVLRSPADGSTALILPSGAVTLLPLIQHLSDEPTHRLQPVVGIGELCVALVVGPTVPKAVTTVPQYVDWVRANPSLANYGVHGLDTPAHFVGREISRIADLPTWKAIAYKILTPIFVDVASGTLPAALTRLPNDDYEAEFPGLRILAVSSDRRWPDFPEVPTLLESKSMTTAVTESLGVFFAPGTPDAKVAELAAAVRAVVATPAMSKVMDIVNMRAMPEAPASYAANLAAERDSWVQLIRQVGSIDRS